MASNLTFSAIYGNRPRLFCRDTDVATLQTRAVTTAGWRTEYDTKIKDYALTLAVSDPDTVLTDKYTIHSKMQTLALVALIEDTDGWYDLLSNYIYRMATLSYESGSNSLRSAILAASWGLDVLLSWASMPDARIKAIGEWLYGYLDTISLNSDELMDGWSAGDAMALGAGAMCLYGLKKSGSYDFTATGSYNAAPKLTTALEFWFGGNASTTQGGYGRITADRYFASQGGAWKGSWYQQLSWWYTHLMLLHVSNALTGMSMSGEDYETFTYESWTGKHWRWALGNFIRGGSDYWQHGDTARSSNPFFGYHERGTIAAMCRLAEDSTSRSIARWIYDKQLARAVALGQSAKYFYAADFIWFDKASVPPANMPTDAPQKIWLDPPGFLCWRDTPDVDNATEISIRIPKDYYLGHPTLNRGEIQVIHKKTVLLTNTGTYDTSPDGDPSDFGGTHSNYWRKQTIAHSGIVLVDDGAATPHTNYPESGGAIAYPSGLGGQYWKRYDDGATDWRDPANVVYMQQHASGLAWKACQGQSDPDAAGEILVDDDECLVLSSNLRRAYLLRHTDIDTSAERVRRYDAKWMIIKSFPGLGRPAIMLLHRVEARLASMDKRQMWHTYAKATVVRSAGNLIIKGGGLDMTNDGQGNPQIWVVYPNESTWAVTLVGGGTTNPYVPGSFDYYYDGTNYPPTSYSGNPRMLPDIGRARAEVAPVTDAAEHTFFTLLLPMRNTESLPTFTWITEDNYLGVEAQGKAYKLHKTQDQYVSPGDPTDVTPPGQPTGLVGTTPASQKAQLVWTPNTEVDIYKYAVEYREKV